MISPRDRQDEPGEADTQAVSRRLAEISHAERHFERDFSAMSDDMAFARGVQWGGDKQGYVVNFTLRHIQTRTAALYAKNPQVVAKRRKRLETRFWDGSASQLLQAQQAMILAAQNGEIDPQAQSILSEAADIAPKKELVDRIGISLSLILEYFLDTGMPSFKEAAKQCVRQALTCGVGWVKIGYRRPGQPQPDRTARAFDLPERSARLVALSPETDPETDEDRVQAEAASFAASLSDASGQAALPEGLVFTFPPATSVICDIHTRSLLGLQGTRWLAEKFYLPERDIEALYGVKLSAADYRRHRLSDAPIIADSGPFDERGLDDCALVYEVWDRERGTLETVCDGYRGYLRRPSPPTVRVNGFFPYHALLFNDVACDRRIYPPSDVSLLRDMQLDTNLARQGVREHRIANRPRQIVRNGAFEEEDQKKLASARAHDVIIVNAPGDSPLQNLIEPVPTVAISPELYSTAAAERDMLLSVGSQEANIGPTSGATATEVGVAEASRQTAMGSQIDDMDQWLSHIVRSAGQILLSHMSHARALEIAGPAAAWPTVQSEDYAQELTLTVKAGSSGKPNRALEIANFERLGPLLMQIPGINPVKLAEELLSRLGDGLDLAEMLDPTAPSIIARNAALNAGQALSAGNAAGAAPEQQPQAQASEGAFNLPSGIGRPGGPQPGYPALHSTGGPQQ